MIILAIEDIFQYLQSKSVWNTACCLTLDAIHPLFDLLLGTLDGAEKRITIIGSLVVLEALLTNAGLRIVRGWTDKQEGALLGAVSSVSSGTCSSSRQKTSVQHAVCPGPGVLGVEITAETPQSLCWGSQVSHLPCTGTLQTWHHPQAEEGVVILPRILQPISHWCDVLIGTESFLAVIPLWIWNSAKFCGKQSSLLLTAVE